MRRRLFSETGRCLRLPPAVLVMLATLAAIALLPVPHRAVPVTAPAPSPTLTEAAVGLDDNCVTLTFDPQHSPQVTAVQTITMTNRTGRTQSSLVLRSYTGAYGSIAASPAAADELFAACYGTVFSSGGLTVDKAAVDGEPTSPSWLDPDAHTVLILTPAEPWLPGQTRTVTLSWHAVVPECASRFGLSGGVCALGNLFPAPALWLGDRWDDTPYLAVGDPFRSDCANWSVTLTMPSGWTAAASAWCCPERSGEWQVCRYEAPAMRDFTLVLSDRWRMASTLEDGVAVTACGLTQHSADAMLTYACQALRLYASLWGDYLYPSFTLAETPFPYGGMEYPGLVMIGSSVASAGDSVLRTTVAHETAHQWWSIMVGSDSVSQPWLDESLAVYAVSRFLTRYAGSAARDAYAADRIDETLQTGLPAGLTPGSPLSAFPSSAAYSAAAYRRAAALWLALERRMGTEALDRALADVQARFRFRFVSREELCSVLSGHAGLSLSPFFADHLDTEAAP